VSKHVTDERNPKQEERPVGLVDERVSTLFVPDTMVPSQYFDRLRDGWHNMSGERRLMLAILEDGIHTYLKFAGAAGRIQREQFLEAEAWIENDDLTWVYAFRSICDHLGLEVDQLRRGLRARKAQAEARTAAGESRVESGRDDAAAAA
jgi:hypothetical protein